MTTEKPPKITTVPTPFRCPKNIHDQIELVIRNTGMTRTKVMTLLLSQALNALAKKMPDMLRDDKNRTTP